MPLFQLFVMSKITCDIAKKLGNKGFEYKNHQDIFKEIKKAIPHISGKGIWSFNDKKIRLFPLMQEEKIKETPLIKREYKYRGTDLVKRVGDFRIQIEKKRA